MRLARLSTVLLAVCVSSWFACAPEPKSAACMTDVDCTSRGAGFTYCVESHCVKCLSDAMCKNGASCLDGVCGGK